MANTPFLDLVKPAGTDKALVSVLNSNSDKIDTGVSTLSDQMAYRIYLNTATVSDCYAKMNAIPTNASGTFFATGDVMSLLTNGNITYSASGTIAKSYGSSSSASFEIMFKYGADGFAVIRLTSMTSSSIGTLALSNISDQIANYIKAKVQTESNFAITTSYSSGAMYYGEINLDQSRFGDVAEILAVTLNDYGGLSNNLMFQILTTSRIRVWSKTSQTLSTLKIKVVYFPT